MDMPAVGEMVLYRPTEHEAMAWGSDPLPCLVVEVLGVLIGGHVFYRGGLSWFSGIPAGDTPGTWRFKPPQIRTS